MKTVGIFEGKAHFSAIVDAAEAGEIITITRKGKPVARLVPIHSPKQRVLGQDDGLGFIAEDFDAPLPPDVLDQFYR